MSPPRRFPGAFANWRRNAIDVTLALTLLAGGIVGTACGVALFTCCARSISSI